MFTGFNPAVSKNALIAIGARVRSWRLHKCTQFSEADLARWINPIVRGWMSYYGAFYRSALYPLLARINAYCLVIPLPLHLLDRLSGWLGGWS